MKFLYIMRLVSYLMIVHIEKDQVNCYTLDNNLFFSLNAVYVSICFFMAT